MIDHAFPPLAGAAAHVEVQTDGPQTLTSEPLCHTHHPIPPVVGGAAAHVEVQTDEGTHTLGVDILASDAHTHTLTSCDLPVRPNLFVQS